MLQATTSYFINALYCKRKKQLALTKLILRKGSAGLVQNHGKETIK